MTGCDSPSEPLARMDHEIWFPFLTPDQLTADRVMVEVDRVIQSNDAWLFDDFFINYIHAPLPVGGGLLRGVGDLTTYLTKKTALIQIPWTADNLCCARAIITAKARLDNHPQWNFIRQCCTIKTHLAHQLHQRAQVREGVMSRKPEWDKFQQLLGPEYQLVIIFEGIFSTPSFTTVHIFQKNRSTCITQTSMPAFLQRAYFCKCCKVGYQDAGTHMCQDSCMCCSKTTKCGFEKWVSCTSFHQRFISNSCYQHHLTTDTCRLVHCCEDCGKTLL